MTDTDTDNNRTDPLTGRPYRASDYRQYPTRHVYIPDRWWDRACEVARAENVSVSHVLRTGIDSVYRLHRFRGNHPTGVVVDATTTTGE